MPSGDGSCVQAVAAPGDHGGDLAACSTNLIRSLCKKKSCAWVRKNKLVPAHCVSPVVASGDLQQASPTSQPRDQTSQARMVQVLAMGVGIAAAAILGGATVCAMVRRRRALHTFEQMQLDTQQIQRAINGHENAANDSAYDVSMASPRSMRVEDVDEWNLEFASPNQTYQELCDDRGGRVGDTLRGMMLQHHRDTSESAALEFDDFGFDDTGTEPMHPNLHPKRDGVDHELLSGDDTAGRGTLLHSQASGSVAQERVLAAQATRKDENGLVVTSSAFVRKQLESPSNIVV